MLVCSGADTMVYIVALLPGPPMASATEWRTQGVHGTISHRISWWDNIINSRTTLHECDSVSSVTHSRGCDRSTSTR